MHKPYLVIVTGRPGSGKTTFSKALSDAACLPLVSRDALKEGYVRTYGKSHNQLPHETNGIVTQLFFSTVEALVKSGVSLVAEAAFQHTLWYQNLQPLLSTARGDAPSFSLWRAPFSRLLIG